MNTASNEALNFPSDMASARKMIEDLRAQVTHLESLAMLDSLTGIANRRAFDERLSAAFSQAKRTHSPLAIAVFDVDNFKRRNDLCGHANGDRCLQALAAQLQACSRRGDTAARIGGEEFAMIFPHTTAEIASEVCRRIAAGVRNCCAFEPLTFSAGVAELDGAMADGCAIVDQADKAMYQAKHAGKDSVHIHRPHFRRSLFKWR